MERLEEFLNTFYEAISYERADCFDSERFTGLFTSNALIAERTGESLCSETITDYVKAFLEEVKNFPDRYNYGSREVQKSYERLNGEDYVLVKSEYEKRVSKTTPDGPEEVLTNGCNYMILCRDEDWFKILSIAWTTQI